jgi:hypothetical protein
MVGPKIFDGRLDFHNPNFAVCAQGHQVGSTAARQGDLG